MKFRKKPVVIEAVKWTGKNVNEIIAFAGTRCHFMHAKDASFDFVGSDMEFPILEITTLEGRHYASIGDWIIKGVKDEVYPCKPDIFELTYEVAE